MPSHACTTVGGASPHCITLFRVVAQLKTMIGAFLALFLPRHNLCCCACLCAGRPEVKGPNHQRTGDDDNLRM